MTILRILFGAGTWGAGGNLVAWVLCGIPVHVVSAWQHRRELRRRLDQLEARVTRRPSDDLAKPGADSGPG